MIIKGRSPTMRHVSRIHSVALNWLFDRINLEPKIQINYVDTKNQLAYILTKGSFSKNEWYQLLWLFKIMSFPTYSTSTSKVLSLSLSSQRAPCDWCHVESTTHNLECWVSGGKGQTYQSGDAGSVQRGCLATKIGISGQSGDGDNRKKRVGLAKGNWGSSGSNLEVESSHVYRQENVNLAHRKLSQKDQTRAKKCREFLPHKES